MKTAFSLFTTKEIKPEGWLRRQLEIQADGLNGNLDKVWPDVRDSQWIGGPCDGWERVPYWLDGFIPLAYLLDDDDRKARAKRYVDKIIENQQPDGWICPNGETPREKYDTWAVLLLSKVLVNYYECSGDERVPEVLYRAMKNYYDLLSDGSISLFSWGKFRWFEGLIALRFLKGRYPDAEWIVGLARLLREQGTDWTSLTELWKQPKNTWTLETHIVNIAMMLKYEAIEAELLGEDYTDSAEKLYQILKRYNGTAVGTFTGDECLSGRNSNQGTELCSVVELMYSFELLYAATGDRKWAERLELVAFNALPATLTDDMWAHQYDQMVNQMDCRRFSGNPIFGSNSSDAHIFGLEPNFGCCTANFGQGWPKLALSAFMKAKDGIVSAVPVPSVVSTVWKGVPVRVELRTEYPFRNRLVYRVTAEAATGMKLRVRVPSFAEKITVNGKPVSRKPMLIFTGFEKGETTVEVAWETVPQFVSGVHKLSHVRMGSLVFSMPVPYTVRMKEYTRDGVERKFPYCDYEFRCDGEWERAFASAKLVPEWGEVTEIPFSSKNPPVRIHAETCRIHWGFEARYDNVCAANPAGREALDAPAATELVPYGCAKLRMTELPLLNVK